MTSDGKLHNNNSTLSGAADTEDDSMMYGMQSPGSLLGSSIRSNQVESFDIESESGSVTGDNSGWRLGMPWFTNSNHKRDLRTTDSKTQELHRYYGGVMKASGELSPGPATPSSTTSNSSRHFRPFRKKNKRLSPSKNGKTSDNHTNSTDERGSTLKTREKETKAKSTVNRKDNLSVPIARTKSSAGDSIADFEESEWTPADSSYGAACPVCGFIPKRVRQMIEMTLIAAMVFFLIYLVVTTSMKIAEAHHRVDGSTSNGSAADDYFSGNNYNRTGSSSSTSTNVVTDDDVYVEKYNNNNGDDAAVVDDTYADDYNQDDAGDDDGGGSDDYSQNYNYYNQGYNPYYGNNRGNNNQYYNNYNRNRRYSQYSDDNYGSRRQLRRASQQEKRINFNTRRGIESIDETLD